MYKIEKDIPIGFMEEKSMYPFGKMCVGDSFFVKGDRKKINAVTVSVSYYKKKHPGTEFITRTNSEGIRVWRKQ